MNENATLQAVGTEQDSIRFTAIDPVEGWHGIRFNIASDDSRLEYCHIENGNATGGYPYSWGGGIYCDQSSLTIENCTITNNSAHSGGGIMVITHTSTIPAPAISNCIISNNSVTNSGGGIHSSWANPTINNCIITGNTAAIGGGIHFTNGGNPSIFNCIISGNSASLGGGISLWYSSLVGSCINNCTIVNNAASEGGGIYSYANDPLIINFILWNNVPQEVVIAGGNLQINYSDIQGGWLGIGNINSDPLFEIGPLSEYHISLGSPCIDAGNPDPQYNDPEDPVNPGYALWPSLGTVRNDMGVYGGSGAGGWVGVASCDELYIPSALSLGQNYPNPFNPNTTLTFEIPKPGYVSLIIYNIQGMEVSRLADGWYSPGSYHTTFDGSGFSSGIYFALLTAGGFSQTKKMLLVK